MQYPHLLQKNLLCLTTRRYLSKYRIWLEPLKYYSDRNLWARIILACISWLSIVSRHVIWSCAPVYKAKLWLLATRLLWKISVNDCTKEFRICCPSTTIKFQSRLQQIVKFQLGVVLSSSLNLKLSIICGSVRHSMTRKAVDFLPLAVIDLSNYFY